MPTMPRPDKDFYEWQSNFVTYAETHGGEMKIPQEGITSLKAPQQRYETAFKKCEDPNRGKLDIAEKHDARDAYEKEIRAFTKGYLYSPSVSDGHRRSMGISDPKNPAPVPAPTTYPEAEADTATLRQVAIHYHDKGSTHRAKPHGVHGAELRWILSDTPVTDVAELINAEFDTASPFTLSFQGHERGKTLYYALRWESTRGEKGPWGEIYTAIVP